jgi:hypothetical protein
VDGIEEEIAADAGQAPASARARGSDRAVGCQAQRAAIPRAPSWVNVRRLGVNASSIAFEAVAEMLDEKKEMAA